MPCSKSTSFGVLAVTSTVKAAQLGKAIAYGAEITQEPFNYIAATTSFMDTFRHKLEFFQCFLGQRRHIRRAGNRLSAFSEDGLAAGFDQFFCGSYR